MGLLISFSVIAQDQDREYQTLVDFNEVRISGLGGPFMQFTMVNGEFAHMMGGGGAVMLNDFWFGGYGLGLTNNIYSNEVAFPNEASINVSHGGFWMGYSFFGDRAVHFNVSSLIGWGSIGTKWDYDPVPDNIFVICPTIELELNLTRYFRLGAGATYNLFTFVDDYASSDFSGPGGFLSFKFGWF